MQNKLTRKTACDFKKMRQKSRGGRVQPTHTRCLRHPKHVRSTHDTVKRYKRASKFLLTGVMRSQKNIPKILLHPVLHLPLERLI